MTCYFFVEFLLISSNVSKRCPFMVDFNFGNSKTDVLETNLEENRMAEIKLLFCFCQKESLVVVQQSTQVHPQLWPLRIPSNVSELLITLSVHSLDLLSTGSGLFLASRRKPSPSSWIDSSTVLTEPWFRRRHHKATFTTSFEKFSTIFDLLSCARLHQFCRGSVHVQFFCQDPKLMPTPSTMFLIVKRRFWPYQIRNCIRIIIVCYHYS